MVISSRNFFGYLQQEGNFVNSRNIFYFEVFTLPVVAVGSLVASQNAAIESINCGYKALQTVA